MNSVKIFLRTDHLNTTGTHTVYIRLISNRRKKDISLHIYVKPNDWMFSKNLVKKSDPKYLRKNKLIKKYLNKAESIVDEYFFNDEQLTFDDFEKKLLNKEYSDASFTDFVNDELAEKNYSAETLKTYLTQITKLQRFKKKLAFSEINKSFITGYKEFMLKELGNNPNTANKSLSMLKTFVNWAVEKNLMKDNPFNNIKITKGKGKREYLNIAELNKLENLYYDKELDYKQLNVLRYFLFVCYTGLRYTDIKNLKYSHIKKRLFRDGEIEFIELKMHKTGLDVSIPIIEKAKKLMPKKIARNQTVFRVLSNQKTNKYLKEIIKTAGIDKNITFHSARHTLATTGLESGIPIEVVSKILGHTEIKMTQIYAKVNDGLKYREMMKLDQSDRQ
ncbi:MAG: site-specific integrase [Chlorobi bacterium]|nr:site-specific integrase [Chlorobiota bacterium]